MSAIRNFFKSIAHALRGLKEIARREQSFRLQLLAALIVIVLTIAIPLAMWERILLLLMVAAVLVLEVMNSVLERISDALKPRLHPVIRDIKDMMAGAVLITSVTATIVAVLIFWTYLEGFLI